MKKKTKRKSKQKKRKFKRKLKRSKRRIKPKKKRRILRKIRKKSKIKTKFKLPNLAIKKVKIPQFKKLKKITFQKVLGFLLEPIFRAYEAFREKRKLEKLRKIALEKRKRKDKLKKRVV